MSGLCTLNAYVCTYSSEQNGAVTVISLSFETLVLNFTGVKKQ